MLFQVAYFLTHGKPCATYEAAQVRKYQLGRTETIRIATEESLAFTKTLIDDSVSDKAKKEALLAAAKVHGQDAKNAADGMGIDRHLFGQLGSFPDELTPSSWALVFKVCENF